MQLSQLERQWRERKCPIFETVAKGDSNPGSLDCESGILSLSYRAPRPRTIHSKTNIFLRMKDEATSIINIVDKCNFFQKISLTKSVCSK